MDPTDCPPPGTDTVLHDLPNGLLSGRRLWRTFLIAEMVALPLALLTITLGGETGKSMLVAHLYSFCIAGLCSSATWLLWPRIVKLGEPRRRIAVLALFFACGLAGAEIARFIFALLYGRPLHEGLRLVDLLVPMSVAGIVGLVLSTIGELRTTIEEKERALAERAVNEARLRQATSDAELAALQARINPHFLFNTLNSIAALIREDPAKAEAVTVQLAALFRYALQAPRAGLVSLEEELRVVREYLEIEQVRLGPRLRYELDVPPELLTERVPPLSLQPLVENAIRHGISTQIDGGVVRVRGTRSDGWVRLTVLNTGRGTPDPGTGEGLDNVRRRLRTTFGPESDVTLTERDGDTEACLAFPLRAAPPA